MRAAWLVLAILVAGCSRPVAEDLPDAPATSTFDGRYAACPPAPVAATDAWNAPSWRVGDHWNYTVWRGDEVEGWENATVVAIGPVGAVTDCAFHVEVRSTSKFANDEAHPDGGAMNLGTRTYDARTLNTVWDERPGCLYLIGDCFGAQPWPYDFPLADGTKWNYTSGGDVVFQLYASVTVTGFKDSLRLNVLHSDNEGEADDHARNGEVFHYSPRTGNAVAWERFQGEEAVERKVLDTHRYQAVEGLVF